MVAFGHGSAVPLHARWANHGGNFRIFVGHGFQPRRGLRMIYLALATGVFNIAMPPDIPTQNRFICARRYNFINTPYQVYKHPVPYWEG